MPLFRSAFQVRTALCSILADLGGSAAMQGIERKVQQLTKVIYHLNAKSEDGGELGNTVSSYENEIEGILRDASERVKRFQAAAAHSTDEKLMVEKVREMELKYEQQKQRALKEMGEFKTRAREAQVRLAATHRHPLRTAAKAILATDPAPSTDGTQRA